MKQGQNTRSLFLFVEKKMRLFLLFECPFGTLLCMQCSILPTQPMVTDFFSLKPVATSVQFAIPVYLEPKKNNLFKRALCSFWPGWFKFTWFMNKVRKPTLSWWIILGSFSPTSFLSRQEADSSANGFSSCALLSPTDKVVVERKPNLKPN